MKLDDFRNLFSKAAIIITDKLIVVRYLYKERWFNQELNKSEFLELLNNSDRFGINCNEAIELIFQGVNHENQNGVYYPVELEITKEEIDNLLKESFNECIYNSDFFEHMMNVNLSNDEELIEAVKEWSDTQIPKVVDIKKYYAWKDMLGHALSFRKYFYAEIESYKPDDGTGIVEIQIPENFSGWFSSEAKLEFEKLITSSSKIFLEGSVDEGVLNIITSIS